MVEFEITQSPGGGWTIRYRVTASGDPEPNQGWSEPIGEIRSQDIGDTLKGLGDQVPEMLDEAVKLDA